MLQKGHVGISTNVFIIGSPVISITVTERESVMSISMPANCINDVGYLPDLISSSNQTSTVNWSAAVSPFIMLMFHCSIDY